MTLRGVCLTLIESVLGTGALAAAHNDQLLLATVLLGACGCLLYSDGRGGWSVNS